MSDAAPINPYEPPQGPIADDRVEAEVYLGPWRDRGLLVVDIDEKDSMPWRCVVSGVEIEPGQRARFSIYPARLNSPIEFLHRYWPISSAKRPRWRPIHVIGWGMIVASVVGFVIGLFSVYAWFLCIVTAFLGGLILRWSSPRWLRIVRVAGRQVWVSGAHPNFLAVLPPWQETARASDAPTHRISRPMARWALYRGRLQPRRRGNLPLRFHGRRRRRSRTNPHPRYQDARPPPRWRLQSALAVGTKSPADMEHHGCCDLVTRGCRRNGDVSQGCGNHSQPHRSRVPLFSHPRGMSLRTATDQSPCVAASGWELYLGGRSPSPLPRRPPRSPCQHVIPVTISR